MMRKQVAWRGRRFGRCFDGRWDLEFGSLRRHCQETPRLLATRIDLQRIAGVVRHARPMPDVSAASRKAKERVALLFADTHGRAQALRVAVPWLRRDGRGEACLRRRQIVRLQTGSRGFQIPRCVRAQFVRRADRLTAGAVLGI
ncbi:hypothetical protein [Paraburkholderia sp. SG-MS1]|uniref:hypothetical protein n=1 Tax=Paraburkholderia sp. SG-MS1 TaxID=2023741 RepID=UPI0014468369|nr:hypothetical protein [Paraburkholderia sp. SG-MS1]